MRYALDIVRRMRRAISAMYTTRCPTAKLTRYCCLVVQWSLFATKGIFVYFFVQRYFATDVGVTVGAYYCVV